VPQFALKHTDTRAPLLVLLLLDVQTLSRGAAGERADNRLHLIAQESLAVLYIPCCACAQVSAPRLSPTIFTLKRSMVDRISPRDAPGYRQAVTDVQTY
jgi:hypothetical protein